ncbi:hypothetical protein, partial [Actinoplanes sp. NPDC051411]|uniref:hypothetical protein n=1 Tax=Actinoplanes sp. NPDC051411 TaxID=3155522 RepID=UPI00342D2DDF
MATPILLHLRLDRDAWFPGDHGVAWVFRTGSTVVTGAVPPAGAQEAWLVDLSRHEALLDFAPPSSPTVVMVRLRWVVTDPVAVVRAAAGASGVSAPPGTNPGPVAAAPRGPA